MPQNIYDDPDFFRGYSELRRTEGGLNQAIEQPALQRLLPSSLGGWRVLDLGCGFGDFARLAREQGASKVVAVDVSSRMLAEARRRTTDLAVIYVCAAMEAYAPEEEAFDLTVSSLALHYVENYSSILDRVFRGLVSGGRFVFSVEHPVCTSLGRGEWHRASDGSILHWPIDHYHDEGKRQTTWFVEGVVKYHRTLETYVNGLLKAGFQLLQLSEPEPESTFLAARPRLELERRRPPFLLLSAQRP